MKVVASSVRAGVRTWRRFPKRPVVGLTLVAVLGASCGGVTHSSSPPSSTLPPLPPAMVGYVTLIGTGEDIGLGTTVVPLNVTDDATGSSVTVGTFPDAVAIAPKTKLAYVANYVGNSVSVISLATGRVVKTIGVGQGPAGIAIAPNGKTAYVTDAGSSPIGDTVVPIDLESNTAQAPITVGDGPQGIAITPDGSMAYVANAGSIVAGQSGPIGDTVTPIDLKTRRALAPIRVGNGPVSVAIAPDGSAAYVANSYSGSVTPIAIASNTAGPPIELTGAPQAIAITPNGSTAWVADAPSSISSANNITPISLSSNVAGTPVLIGKDPTDLAITPDGSTVWVVCSGAGDVTAIHIAGAKPIVGSSVQISGGPYAIALISVPQGSAIASLPSASPKSSTTKAKSS